MPTWPCAFSDRKRCGFLADITASTATLTEPSVPFLKPTGQESADASSRCSCDSVVRAPIAPQATRSVRRSEEHTSELQSLMRISYAVFCLKKKKTTNNTQQLNLHTTNQ